MCARAESCTHKFDSHPRTQTSDVDTIANQRIAVVKLRPWHLPQWDIRPMPVAAMMVTGGPSTTLARSIDPSQLRDQTAPFLFCWRPRAMVLEVGPALRFISRSTSILATYGRLSS